MSRCWLILCVACALTFGTRAELRAEFYTGTIVKAAEGKIKVTYGENQTLEVDVSPKVKISRNARPAKLADLKEGDTVKVTTEDQNGKSIAIIIIARAKAE